MYRLRSKATACLIALVAAVVATPLSSEPRAAVAGRATASEQKPDAGKPPSPPSVPTAPAETSPPGRGFKKLDSVLPNPYPKRWAVVIGINYAAPAGRGADPTRPAPLKNAVNDADEVFTILCKGYGYAENQTAFKLTEEKATKAEIEKHLADVLCDPTKVKPSDSVLVYFAGHGMRRKIPTDPNKRDGVILAWDAKLHEQDQQPAASYLKMSALVERLRDDCPARHKLLVLDCCYSGEMFRGEAQAVEVRESAWSRGAYLDPAFQGMASARNSESVPDAYTQQPNHSPFTYGLTEALKRLPRSQGPGMPVTASRVFSFIDWAVKHNEFNERDQSPGVRWLTGDQGEFHFFPDPKLFDPEQLTDDLKRLFAPEQLTDDDILAGTMLLPGSYGAWWFTEVPWFIPGLRAKIVQAALDAKNGPETVRGPRKEGLHKYLLQAATSEVVRRKEEWTGAVCKPDPRDVKPNAECRLIELRLHCLDRLRDEAVRKEPRGVYEDLLAKLDTARREDKLPLEAGDLHLRAVLCHRLGRADARAAYDEAIGKYDGQIAARKDHPAGRFVPAPDEGLRLLCLADKAEYLHARRAYVEAARTFDRALLAGVPPPPAFRVYALVRAADCWQAAGHARETDERLAAAFAAATGPRRFPGDAGPSRAINDELTSYVHYRRAWAYVDQFDYAAAERHFESSTLLLDALTRGGGTDRPRPDRSGVWGARIMRLHNQHGLAITARYAGDFGGSAERYQLLIREVREQFAILRREGGLVEEVLDVREQLAERLVNAWERRGECFLYRDNPDVKEAQAELAQAARVCPYLTAATRDARRAEILFKLALAYAVPSPYQDLELAARSHREAAELGAKPGSPFGVPPARGVDGAVEAAGDDPNRILRELTDALIRFYQAVTPGRTDQMPGAPPEFSAAAGGAGGAAGRLGALRKTVQALRPDANRNLSRDELDVLLTGCKTLLTEGMSLGDRYTQLADAELTLGLTRIAIRGGGRNMQAYFRHYYDAAIRAMVAARPRHVKGLIEAAWEATTGRAWEKPTRPAPLLATYVLDGRFLFFLDVPDGVSKVYSGGDVFALARVERAARRGAVALPAELADELARLADGGLGGGRVVGSLEELPVVFAAVGGGMAVVPRPIPYRADRLNMHWYDPIYGIGAEPPDFSGGVTVSRPGALSNFPFALPDPVHPTREP